MSNSNYVYEVEIEHGRNHPEWRRFHANVTDLNGKESDFTSTAKTFAVKHQGDRIYVHSLCTQGMKAKRDVTVKEITRKTLNKEHDRWIDLIRNYYRPMVRIRI